MKKRLEADLISIAHRILQLKNKSDVNQLYLETQRLYEKLAVLRFVEDHFGDVKPTIGLAAIEQEIATVFDKAEAEQPETSKKIEAIVETPTIVAEEVIPSEEPSAENSIEAPVFVEEVVLNEEETIEVLDETPVISMEDVVESIDLNEEKSIVEILIDSEETAFEPVFETTESVEKEAPKKPAAVQISFEELLGGNYDDTHFVKVQPAENSSTASVFEAPVAVLFEEEILEPIAEASTEKTEPKSFTLNEKLAKGINIDLNDRIAFIKHLFANSEEEYNRVLSQLITYDSFEETQTFIDQMVKPDYNNWYGKEDYEQRFQGIIAKKFV